MSLGLAREDEWTGLVTDVGHRRTADQQTLQGGKWSPFYGDVRDRPRLSNFPDSPSQSPGQTRHPGQTLLYQWCEWTRLYVAFVVYNIPKFANTTIFQSTI